MYINEVIRLVKSLCPSEYDESEMYVWCNEVSSMLSVEERDVWIEKTLSVADDGCILLPEGVEITDVAYISANGRELYKQDLRSHGISRDFIKGNNPRIFTVPNLTSGTVKIVYRAPFEPIRLTRYRGSAVISDGAVTIRQCEFIAGDTVDIIIPTQSGDIESQEDAIPVLCIKRDDEDTQASKLIVPKSALADMSGEYEDCIIIRRVCEETVCSAPYDGMYIDYILAKIAMYRRDMEAYSHHMSAFNSRLSAYRKWLVEHMPCSGGRLTNWW